MPRYPALLIAAVVLALTTTSSFAQVPEGDAVQDEALEYALPTPTPDPCRTPDADYTYACRPCPSPDADYQTEADYAYCTDAVPARATPPRGPRRRRQSVQALPAAGTLPLTGSEPRLIGLMGLGLLFAGAGLRLTNAAARQP